MKCPHCDKDIREATVLKGAAAIVAKRRRLAGNQITSEQARKLQARSVEARRANERKIMDARCVSRRISTKTGKADRYCTIWGGTIHDPSILGRCTLKTVERLCRAGLLQKESGECRDHDPDYVTDRWYPI